MVAENSVDSENSDKIMLGICVSDSFVYICRKNIALWNMLQ